MKTKLTALIDFSQLAYASFFINQTTVGSINFWKFSVLNMIRKILMTCRPNEVVLCCDHRSWRKDIFPLYKHSRKQKVGDMAELYTFMDSFISELREKFPYKIVQVDKGEGDDVLAVLAEKLTGNIVIVSGDKDLLQCIKGNVYLYSPFKDETVDSAHKDPGQLDEMLIRGDSGDGVPNILSRDEIFTVEGERQKSITKKLLAEIHNAGGLEHWIVDQPEAIRKNYERNKKLIILSMENIPFDIQTAIMKQYYEANPINDGKTVADYLREKEMYSFNESVNEFLLNGVTYDAPFVEVPTMIEEDKDISGLFE